MQYQLETKDTLFLGLSEAANLSRNDETHIVMWDELSDYKT